MSNFYGRQPKVKRRCCICGDETYNNYKVEPYGWMCQGKNSCADAFFEWRKFGRRQDFWTKVHAKKPSGRPSNELEKETGVVT